MASNTQTIACKTHGKITAAIVCRHLVNNNGKPLGFIENSSVPDDLQGWCFACEFFFQQQEGMTDDFKEFNDMSIVCIQCYSEIKSKHSITVLFKFNL
jgi:hypothetical protein